MEAYMLIGAYIQILRCIVSFTERAFQPVSVPASIQGALTLMEQKMVSTVRANHKVSGAVIELILVYAVDYCAGWQRLS